MVTVGVLGLQGDFLEHVQMLKNIEGVKTIVVKAEKDLKELDALILPGGESTTIGRLMERSGLKEAVAESIRKGMPVLGTCAGLILLAKRIKDRVVGEVDQPTLALMDLSVIRNGFGRQKESFEVEVHLNGVGKVPGVFIRAPIIDDLWGKAEAIGSIHHPVLGHVTVAAKQENMIGIAFHPEIGNDPKIHKMLITMARK